MPWRWTNKSIVVIVVRGEYLVDVVRVLLLRLRRQSGQRHVLLRGFVVAMREEEEVVV
jgi:hypothetical protein